MTRRIATLAALAALVLVAPAAANAKTTIKLASLLPDGAPGTQMLHDAAKRIEEKSGGEIDIKLYLGTDGDEADIVRKMKIGQRSAAQMTGVGLSQIVPSIHVLDLPFFFDEYGEVDYVYEHIRSHFDEAFEKEGYVFLGFAETGFVYLYSKQKMASLDELRSAKVWAWEGDPLTTAFVEHAQLQARPLAPPDVLTSLQTGMIDTVYGPPLGLLALQWFTKVEYMLPVPFVHATGGVVMTKRAFDKLTPENQELVKTEFDKISRMLTRELRKLNEESAVELTASGIKAVDGPSAEDLAEIKQISAEVAQKVVGQIYSQELLDEVTRLRDEYRAQQAGGGAATEASEVTTPEAVTTPDGE